MAKFLVLGAGGFVGRALVNHLRGAGHDASGADRGQISPMRRAGLGEGDDHVIYCVGLTADFRTRPFDTIEAHVSLLSDLLRHSKIGSFLYLSSTRVYDGAADTAEDAALKAKPGADHLYNLSKLTGEALVLAQDNPQFRVARLSNIAGPGQMPVMFLPSVNEEARKTGKVTFQTSPKSGKDYILIDDVVRLLASIALGGAERIYNVASGVNTTNEAIAALVRKYLAAEANFAAGAPTVIFPEIDTRRIKAEFNFVPRPFEEIYRKSVGVAGTD